MSKLRSVTNPHSHGSPVRLLPGQALNGLFRDLSRHATTRTDDEYEMLRLVQLLISAGVETLNCLSHLDKEAVQAERVKYYAVMNRVNEFLGNPPVNPVLDKNEDCY